MITEEEKVNIKRDIACNSNKIDELKKEFKGRDPAKETYQHFNKYDVMFTKMQNNMESLKESLEKIEKRIGRIEQFIISLLVLFALAAVYFIFTKTGLKIN